MLSIKSTESFRNANQKTDACALMNIEDRGGRVTSVTLEKNALISQKSMQKCLYGDIPESYRTK